MAAVRPASPEVENAYRIQWYSHLHGNSPIRGSPTNCMDWLLTASEARFGQLTVEVMTPLDTRWRTLHLLETSSLTRLGFKQRAWALLKQYLPLCSS